MPIIEVSNLTKDYKLNVRKKGLLGSIQSLIIPEYKMKRAVEKISFTIEKGDMVGFIGPNGAGKSTTVKMLTGILTPTDGEINILGMSPSKQRKKIATKIGVVFGQRTQLWWDLPVSDTFDLLKSIYRISDSAYKKNMEMFNELLGLKEFITQPVRQLSLGQRMRADIAASLVHNPDIILFDEPTIGLDVIAKEKIREFIKVVNKEKNTTMLFTTHDMMDIEKTCKRMIIIDHGTIIYDGTVNEIKEKHGKKRTIVAEFAQNINNIILPEGVEITEEADNKKHMQFNRDEVQVSEVISYLTSKYNILDLTIKEPEIESIIREIYEGGIDYDKTVSGDSEEVISEQLGVSR
ncbi:ABC-2 type transport system ATP-binding protein [Ruminiclostridium sufflavum DSM 19573]|uniref:ABC-2 type transport system ATP-binding protein n=1 Tax=Ruminiclostridium sufflavum DSM 19573 TaxID=1121337 RepID=A0A318XSL5_9FIRM|nr:ATP-binding cassette domain-containing protein [Ruminiclostridium sufflavum]PYG89574.1 ABC-2 type transport system ATP-binding protein [Ruminiclostridium sufflavum DSM 19573]